MGYSFTIGEAVIDMSPDDGLESSCRVDARSEHHNTAPAFGEPTDYTNERWPSYTAWFDFCEATGLMDVFYYDRNIRGGHPGAFPVTKEMQVMVDTAMIRVKKLHPNAKATYDNDDPIEGNLCRLTWLKYWVDWSLENCERPVVANT